MNIAEGVKPDLQKRGTIEEQNYENDMTRHYVLNADCEKVTIDVTELNIQPAEYVNAVETVFDFLTIGEERYYGAVAPFKVKLTLALSIGHKSGKCSKKTKSDALSGDVITQFMSRSYVALSCQNTSLYFIKLNLYKQCCVIYLKYNILTRDKLKTP